MNNHTNQGELRVYHYLSNAGVLQQWQRLLQLMVLLDTTTNA